MKKKIVILVGLLAVLGLVTGFSVKLVKGVNASKKTVAVSKSSAEKTISIKTNEPKETSNKEKKSIFDEEQVVSDHIYPLKDLATQQVSEDKLPKGTVVNVKPVKGDADWVEIVSDPPKGFIEAKYLSHRSEYIDKREKKRVKKLKPKALTKHLNQAIDTFLAENGGDVSVYLETVNHDYSYSYDGDKVRRTASSIKLPFIAYLMTLADEGKVDLNTKLTYTANFKIDGTGIIQFEPIGTQYTIKQLAELVVRYSDNVAYLMLLNYIGEPNFVQFLAELDPQSPNNRVFSTPRILTKAMEYVYEEKDSNKNMKLLYEWIQNSTFDDGVDVGLPGVDVAHKTGWMPMYTVSNDIALVKDKKQPYFITIMTSGYDSSYSEQSISDLSAIIDDYMLQLDLSK
ncbi:MULTISPECIES: serine hydrolase [Vagococcus]|uniref:serine hydrolase n=1 Tax=Vagococcus TaxID=2737 RepID=UPI000E528585|nr:MULTISPECIES: serine hydrolase [Vagococcus]RHH67269.1 serine hydrolase [Vagococcus sp. AM17-17]